MSISFNQIPNNLLVPGVYTEVGVARNAGDINAFPTKVLVLGQKTSEGSANALTPQLITGNDQVRSLFGAGSELDLLLSSYRNVDTFSEVYAVAIDEAVSGQQATAKITVGGTVNTGTISLYIAPFYEGSKLRGKVSVPVTQGQETSAIATAIATAINKDSTLPVTASASESAVTLTAKNKGECGNDIAVVLNYFDGEVLPTGLTLTFEGTALNASATPATCFAASAMANVAYYGTIDPARPFQTLPMTGILQYKTLQGCFLKGGTGNPDISAILAQIGDEYYSHFLLPYSDDANLSALKLDLADRRTPLRQIPAIAITSKRGSHSELITLGDKHNSQDLCIVGVGINFTKEEQNLLLQKGVSTYTTESDGTLAIQRLRTTSDDEAYQDLNTPLILMFITWDFPKYIKEKYPRSKLADDGVRVSSAQAVITPIVGKSEAIARYKTYESIGIVEGVDYFVKNMVCERDAQDKNRLNWSLPVNVINQFRVGAVQISFSL